LYVLLCPRSVFGDFCGGGKGAYGGSTLWQRPQPAGPERWGQGRAVICSQRLQLRVPVPKRGRVFSGQRVAAIKHSKQDVGEEGMVEGEGSKVVVVSFALLCDLRLTKPHGE
jgi:hypothetical protein